MKKFESTMSMLETAEQVLKLKKDPLDIYELLNEVAQIKNIDTEDVDLLTQLYLDITMSGKFVFVGENKWDLKERNLEFWDKDGYAFITEEEILAAEEEAEELDFQEFLIEEIEAEKAQESDDDDEDEEIDENIEDLEEEKQYLAEDIKIVLDDDEDEDLVDDFDDDEYNEMMDDYEDMYD